MPPCRAERPIEELFPAPDVLLFRPGEVWIGNHDASSKRWTVASAAKRKMHGLTDAQMQTMFQGFAVVR
jgi:hypothetical protein